MRILTIIGDISWFIRRAYLSLHGISKLRDLLYFTIHGISWRPSWCLYGLPQIRRHPGAAIVIGHGFVACSRVARNSLGVTQPVVLNALGRESRIVIGDNVGISGCTISAARSIVIGNRVMLGSGCLITDSDAHPLRAEDRADASKTNVAAVVIEDDVFVGARSIILKGVHIGCGSVVGAGSVVSREVPARVVVAGNPARIVRQL